MAPKEEIIQLTFSHLDTFELLINQLGKDVVDCCLISVGACRNDATRIFDKIPNQFGIPRDLMILYKLRFVTGITGQ